MVRKEGTVVGVQPPGNAPAVPKNLRFSPREIDAGRVEIGNEAVDVGNVNRNGKGIESSQIGWNTLLYEAYYLPKYFVGDCIVRDHINAPTTNLR
jgi:hypothetical protein